MRKVIDICDVSITITTVGMDDFEWFAWTSGLPVKNMRILKGYARTLFAVLVGDFWRDCAPFSSHRLSDWWLNTGRSRAKEWWSIFTPDSDARHKLHLTLIIHKWVMMKGDMLSLGRLSRKACFSCEAALYCLKVLYRLQCQYMSTMKWSNDLWRKWNLRKWDE